MGSARVSRTASNAPSSATGVSPARLVASETLKLPRWALVALCLLYILPGLVGRDPWKSEDAATFGAMLTMARELGDGGTADWLLPSVMGAPVLDSGPLMLWTGAGFIALAGSFLGDAFAARLATVLYFLMAVTGVWYATYLVGRRPAAQPVKLAFGGQPAPVDYGRLLGDGALLILLATIGLVVRAHESSSDVAMLAMLAMALYGMARSLDAPKAGAAWIGISIAGLWLSRGPAPAVAIALLWTTLVLANREFRDARRAAATIAAPVALAGLALWPVLAFVFLPDASTDIGVRVRHWRDYFDGIDARALNKYVRTLPWSTWIAWPLAGWGVWTWRHRLSAAHIALPGGFVIAMLGVCAVTSDTSDGQLLLVLPGLVMLAASGLPTLRRGAANAIDWFSLLLYSIAAIFVWFSWFARTTGVPSAYARSLARLSPGATPEFQPLVFVLALLATVAWMVVVAWRVRTHPKVLWRSVVLASGGLILAWTLSATLFLDAINDSRTYRDVAGGLTHALLAAGSSSSPTASNQRGRARATVPAPAVDPRLANAPGGSCVATDGLGLAQRASFAWFGQVRFAKVGYDGANLDDCDFLLRQDLARNPRATALPTGRWKLIWEGRRATDRDENFRLYRKTGTATTRGAGDAVDRDQGRLPAPAPLPPAADTRPTDPVAPVDASKRP